MAPYQIDHADAEGGAQIGENHRRLAGGCGFGNRRNGIAVHREPELQVPFPEPTWIPQWPFWQVTM